MCLRRHALCACIQPSTFHSFSPIPAVRMLSPKSNVGTGQLAGKSVSNLFKHNSLNWIDFLDWERVYTRPDSTKMRLRGEDIVVYHAFVMMFAHRLRQCSWLCIHTCMLHGRLSPTGTDVQRDDEDDVNCTSKVRYEVNYVFFLYSKNRQANTRGCGYLKCSRKKVEPK